MTSTNPSTASAENAPLISKATPQTGSANDYGTSNGSNGAGKSPTQDITTAGQEAGSVEDDEAGLDPAIIEARKNMPIIFASLSMGIILSAMDGSIVNASYARISTSYDRLDLAPWITASFFLALGCVSPLYGKLSDIFGRKPLLMVAFTGFGIGSLLCGLAPTMQTFIAARVLQGMGGGGIGIVSTVMMSDIVSIRDRATWQAYMNLQIAMGSVFGAPVGGWIADTIGWRWSFFLQLPLIIIAILVVFFTLKLPHKDINSWQTSVRQIDFSGAILLASLVFSILFGLQQLAKNPIRSPDVWIPLAAFPVIFVLFIFNEIKFATNPFLPLRAITNRSVLMVFASSFLCYGAAMALIFDLPLFLQAAIGYSAGQSALRLVPITFFSIGANVVTGKMLKRTGKYYTYNLLGNLFAAVSVVITVLATVFTQYSLPLVLVGAIVSLSSFGMALASSLIALLANIEKSDQATLTGCLFTLRYVGSAVTISFCGTVINYVLRRNLYSTLESEYPTIDAAPIVSGVLESLEYIRDISDPILQQTVRAVYAGAIRWAFAIHGGMWAVAFVMCLFIRAGKLEKGNVGK